MTTCAGCGRSMTPLTRERAVWYCGDGTTYGWCCWRLAAAHVNGRT